MLPNARTFQNPYEGYLEVVRHTGCLICAGLGEVVWHPAQPSAPFQVVAPVVRV